MLKRFKILLLASFVFSNVNAQTCFDPDSCWPHVITSDNHTIIITKTPTLDGNPLPAGSYIGVFFKADSTGTLQCGGKQQWNGTNTTIAAFGNDGSIPPVGFANGETFKFKYLLPTGEIVDSVLATFETPQGVSGILTHTGNFANLGLSRVDSMSGSLALNISGSISSELGSPVRSCTVRLTGSKTDSIVTANDGLYDFDVEHGGTYTITPFKNNDINPGNGISTLDIVLVQRQILAIQPLPSPYKIIAADVNASSTVTTLDIVLMRSVILANNRTFPNGRLWEFVSSNFAFSDPVHPFPFDNKKSYNNISQTFSDQNFKALKLGDVNNSWDPNTPKMQAVGEVQFIMEEYLSGPGEEVVVPVTVKDFTNIAGYQFTLTWDAEVLSMMEVNNKSIHAFYGEHLISEGILTTSCYDEAGKSISLNNKSVAFELKFRAVGPEGSFSEISIGAEPTLSEAYNANLQLLSIVPTRGMVKVIKDAPTLTYNLHRIQVQPNPFTTAANILFALSQDETVSIEIYDILGKVVKHFKANYKPGENQIAWNGDDDDGHALSKGLYHVRIKAGECTGVVKAVLVR